MITRSKLLFGLIAAGAFAFSPIVDAGGHHGGGQHGGSSGGFNRGTSFSHGGNFHRGGSFNRGGNFARSGSFHHGHHGHFRHRGGVVFIDPFYYGFGWGYPYSYGYGYPAYETITRSRTIIMTGMLPKIIPPR